MPITVANNPQYDEDVTYTLVVSGKQLCYLALAMHEFVEKDPAEDLDQYGQDIPRTLDKMLSDDMAPNPCVNGLVL